MDDEDDSQRDDDLVESFRDLVLKLRDLMNVDAAIAHIRRGLSLLEPREAARLLRELAAEIEAGEPARSRTNIELLYRERRGWSRKLLVLALTIAEGETSHSGSWNQRLARLRQRLSSARGTLTDSVSRDG